MREQMLPVPYWALINPSAVLRDCHKVLKKELLLLWPSCGSSCTHLQTHHRSHRRWEQQALCRQTDTGQVRRHVRLLLCVWWFVYYSCFGAPLFIGLGFIVFNWQTCQQLVVTRINQDEYNLKYIYSFFRDTVLHCIRKCICLCAVCVEECIEHNTFPQLFGSHFKCGDFVWFPVVIFVSVILLWSTVCLCFGLIKSQFRT